MLRRQFASCLSGLVGLWLASSAFAAPVVGQPAPDFSLTDTAGKLVRLSDFRGKHVVLEWTNPGCPFVRKHYGAGNMQALQREAAAKGVVWLAANSTEPNSGDYLKPHAACRLDDRAKAAPSATLMDEAGGVGQSYGARTTPHMYIVSPQGTLLYAGAIDSIPSSRVDDIKTATNYVRQSLTEALASKPISTPVTKPYGCSVKYKA
ncbi:MAG: thioredoxin family protein [Rhodoferax sp.]|nr:thioredoxin family protein [Rhodoferax sp.]